MEEVITVILSHFGGHKTAHLKEDTITSIGTTLEAEMQTGQDIHKQETHD